MSPGSEHIESTRAKPVRRNIVSVKEFQIAELKHFRVANNPRLNNRASFAPVHLLSCERKGISNSTHFANNPRLNKFGNTKPTFYFIETKTKTNPL